VKRHNTSGATDKPFKVGNAVNALNQLITKAWTESHGADDLCERVAWVTDDDENRDRYERLSYLIGETLEALEDTKRAGSELAGDVNVLFDIENAVQVPISKARALSYAAKDLFERVAWVTDDDENRRRYERLFQLVGETVKALDDAKQACNHVTVSSVAPPVAHDCPVQDLQSAPPTWYYRCVLRESRTAGIRIKQWCRCGWPWEDSGASCGRQRCRSPASRPVARRRYRRCGRTQTWRAPSLSTGSSCTRTSRARS